MLTKIFPFLDWFKGYKGSDFKIDLIAGITVAMVLIPQSMAYAQLAGLPPYYGLYAPFLPPMVASLFGSSAGDPEFDPAKNRWEHKLPSIDVTGGVASVKVELSREGKLVYTDYLSLIKFDSGWRIVAKVYHKHG